MISTNGVMGNYGNDIPAQCGRWSNERNFDWCYLKGGMRAKLCPGATLSRTRTFYWSKHPSVCQGRSVVLLYRVHILYFSVDTLIIAEF